MNLTKTLRTIKEMRGSYSIIIGAFFLINPVLYGQTTNAVNIVRDGVTFTFSVSCDNGPCEYGQFVNGDYWVASNTPQGKVLISSISPNGELSGAMVNPDLQRGSNNPEILLPLNEQQQGVLNSYSHYNPELNLMNALPYMASPGESIYKILGTTNGCGTLSIEAGCVQTATILTVLSEIPAERGANTFRPPFHGDWKPLFTTDKVRMDRLPSLPQASEGANGSIGGEFGFTHWLTPELELYHDGLGEFHRAVIPHAAQPSYASDQALVLLEDITKVFGVQSIEEKRMAVYSLIQKGIDNYGVYKMRVPFSSGAGQHMGKKPPLVFFAAMYDDDEILEEVRGMSSDESLLESRFFQEDSQVRMGKSGMAIWGDFKGNDNIHWYFPRLYPQVDGNGTLGDPYSYIDGPAGGIHPDPAQARDRNYLPVVGGLYVGYALLQHLMPWYKYASNDFEVLQFADRVYMGYGIDDFDGGLWTIPDPVAPYDRNESADCQPFRLYSTGQTNCNLYMQTWGPSPDEVSDFIAHNGDPNKDGRMPELHGNKIAFNRVPSIVRDYWTELRPCSDPSNPNYPCQGLGAVPDEVDIVVIDDEEIDTDIFVLITDSEGFSFKTKKTYNRIDINLFSITGALIYSKSSSGDEIELKINETGLLSSSMYIYNLYLDGKVFSDKIMFLGY